MGDERPAGAGAVPGAGGLTAVQIDGLVELGGGLGALADQLGSALRAVDSLPLDAVGPVLGPVGGEFVGALHAATARHREVLADLTRVAGAAGDLVLQTGRMLGDADAATAAALPSGGRVTGV